MKRILIFAAMLLSVAVSAQNYNVLEEVKADRLKAAGMEGAYRFEENKLTPSPKGYRPFYISHYGRHGSRYAWTSRAYTEIGDVLTEAEQAGNLTPFGVSFLERYLKFCEVPIANIGDLVQLGEEQHARIAEEMARNFPKVFSGHKRVDAMSSVSGRCIVSMASFTTSLQKQFPKIDIHVKSNHLGMGIVAPPEAPKGYVRHFEGSDPDSLTREKLSQFIRRKVDVDGIMGHIFKDPSAVKHTGGTTDLLYWLYMFMGNYPNYSDPDLFSDVLTDEQYTQLWETYNYSSYLNDITERYQMIPLLENILEYAGIAIVNQDTAADLRFGHDYVLEAFIALLNLDGFGTIPEKADDVKYWFQSYRICKATNLQFVFYHSPRGNKDILFKILWNGSEASIPALRAVSGPYYRWDDFVTYAQGIITAHPETEE
ncbi:MAG: hypothetical protein IKX60_01085 [Bacteroidales bacterium]|nr:hypothetical protein [Bacteroidales bacterium]